MSVAYQGSSRIDGNSGTSLSATLSYTIVTAGSMLIAFGFINYYQVVSLSDSKGNVWNRLGDFGGDGSVYFCSSNNGTGATTLTFTGYSAGEYTFEIGEYTGAVRLTQAVVQNFAVLQTSVNCGPVPATIAGAVGFATTYSQASSYTSSTGSTNRTTPALVRTFLLDNLSSTGPYTEVGTFTGNMQYGGSILLFGFTLDVPISLVNHAEGSSWSSTPITGISSASFNAVAGNTILVVHNDIPSGSVLNDTAGNTYIQIPCGNQWFWIANNIKGNASNVITANWGPGTSTFVYLSATQWTGLDKSNPVDICAYTNFGSSGAQNPFSPPIMTSWAYEALVGWVQSSDAVAGVGPGYTFIANPGATPELVEYQIVQSIQNNVQATATETSVAGWGMAIIALVGSGQRSLTSPSGGNIFRPSYGSGRSVDFSVVG